MNNIIQDTIKLLNKEFPDYSGTCHVRYELGEPFSNGSDERIKQVYERSMKLFEEIFDTNDIVTTIIKDRDTGDDIMFGDTTPNYIYDLLDNGSVDTDLLDYLEDVDDDGRDVIVELPYKLTVAINQIHDIQYQEILEGIANYEQGREPSIGQSVYFLCEKKGILFHMYDDRGLIIYANDPEKLRIMYDKHNAWLVDYWRETIDKFFV